MIRSFLRRLSSRNTLLGFFRIPAFASPANRRRTAVLALIVLAMGTFGGYVVTANSSAESSHWQQLVNRYENFAKTFAGRTALPMAGVIYYSQGSTDPGVTTNWNTVRAGGGTSPANFTGGDIFVIQNTHNMPTTAAWAISGASSKLQIENGGTLTANNAVTLAAATTFQIDAGGTYVHNNATAYGSSIFQAGTESFDAASTVILNNSNTTGPSGVAFGNLTVNFTTDPGGSVNLAGNITTINGSLTIISTSTREFRLSASTTLNLTIGGDLVVQGGTLDFASSAGSSTNRTANIGGSYNQTGGTVKCTGSSNPVSVNFTGNNKTFTQSAGTLTNTNINWTVNNGASLTLASNLPVATSRNLAVNGTLNCGTNIVTGAGSFFLNIGATLGIGSPAGVTGGAAGNIQTTARSFNAGTTFIYNGSTNQTTGSVYSVINNLTIANTGGAGNNIVTLSANLEVSGTLALTSGILTTTSTNLLTVSNTAQTAVSGGSATAYVNGPLARLLPASLASGSTYSFPVGKAGFNPFELVNPTTNAGGTVMIQAEEFDGSSGGTAGTGLSALNTNRYWQGLITTGGGNFTNTAVRLTDATVTAANAIGKSATQGGSYDSIGGAVSGSTITSNTISSFSFFNIGTAMTAAPPTITAGGPLTRQQGSAAINSTIATVSDASAGALTVTATTLPTGITVTNIVNSSGTVTADVAAGCNATVGANTVVLTVTNDTTGLMNTANLTVNVTANTAPTLGTYPTASVTAGNNTTVTPNAAPADNGSVMSITAAATGAMQSPFTGVFTVNPTTGVVTITDAKPAGTYTVTATAMDNCGLSSTSNFTLTVNNPANCSSASFGFSPAAVSLVGVATVPYSVAVGDFNGDGKQDLAVASTNGFSLSAVTILLGNGSGGFSPASGSPVSVGSNSTFVAVGDFNGDGRQDLAVVGSDMTILLGNGSGGFSPASGSPVSVGGPFIAVGDFNGDGKQDIAGSSGTILLGNGDGSFSPSPGSPISVEGGNIAVGDFNSDGNQDLAFANFSSNNITILLGDGSGGFSPSTGSPIGVGSNPRSVVVGDFNGDGEQDIAVANKASNNVTILLGNGSGGFGQAAGSPIVVGLEPGYVVVGDFNSDGKQDLTVTNQQSASVTILLGNGSGDFSLASGSPVGVGTQPESVAVGDFNSDGKQDLTVANAASNNLTILLNNCAPTIAASTVTRQQGSPSGPAVQIATVSDAEDTAGSLTVAVIAGGTATGITIGPLTNTNGVITATVEASCMATAGTVQLQVTDSTGLTATSDLQVNIDPNTPPTLTYTNASISVGGSTTINPATGPSDNGSVSTIIVQNAGTYTGTISVDNSTGEISISDAAPPGMHTITIRATDNCGGVNGITDATFTLTVSCPSIFTVDSLDDTPDGNPGDGICADIDFQCTLRAAFEEANELNDCAPLTINFSVTGTINLEEELPFLIHPNLTIQGPGANLLDIHRDSMDEFGILSVAGDAITINDLTVSNGHTHNEGSGGGIYNEALVLTINRCHINGNTAAAGGGVGSTFGTVNINDSTISNNSANDAGGGVYNFSSEGMTAMTLTNCTISGNSVADPTAARTAGGVDNSSFGGIATINLINCTVANNSTVNSANAGGIFSGVFDDDGEANISLKNTILAGNANAQALIEDEGAITSQGNNLDGDGSTGFTNGVNGDLVGTVGTPINPLLATLGNYGGSMPTHALLPGSPAINAGTSTGAPATDQRGIARPQLTLFDIGAFESQGFTLAIANGNNQSAVVNSAFSMLLSVTVTANDAGVPVDGGIVTFTPPGSGASATVAGNPATIAGGTAISGTVTANSVTGTYSVSADASGATAPVNFSLTNTCQTITVIAPGINTGTEGAAFSQMFTQTGGIGATTFSTASTLPNGITLAADGTLAGTPTQGGAFPLAVVATDSNGCTGSVNYTLTINALPTINAVAVSRTEGSPVSNSTVANVNDAETAAGSLTVTVNSGAMATVNGVTVSNLNNASGTVTADVAAACGATMANFTLTVTDGGGATNTATLTVTVDANTPPVLTYNNASVLTGGSQMINPATGPSDNGSVSTIAVQDMGTYTGGISVNNMTGVVSISAAAPAGTHTITIRATDDCGDFTDATFTLTIGCVNALTVNDLGEGADFAPGDGVCETASGNGVCTLRAAVEEANALPACSPFTITFSVTGTITLMSGQLVITHPNLTINGPGATMLTVSGNSASRVFQVNSGVTASLSGMTLTGGNGIGAIENATGGAIYNAGTLTVTNCTVINNATGLGGGIRNHGGQLLTVTDSLITGNAAFAQGAGILSDSGPLTITGSTISNNTNVSGGSNTGGGIEAYGTTLITNSTISGNQAITVSDSAGGIWSTTGATTITACTITGNSASGSGSVGGVKSAGGGGSVTVRNSIIAGNSGSGGANPDVNGAFVSNGYNLIGDGTGGTGFTGTADQVGTSGTPINPMLGMLLDNGGPAPTHLPLAGSPAIDKGNAFSLTTDQRGLTRPVDLAISNATSGDGSDIGAVELANTAPAITADGPFIRQQGSPAGAAVQIATVSDGQSAAGSLTVTATTVPMGIMIGSITNTNGTITATIAAACDATLGSNTVTLTVSDGSLTATANLTVSVTANDPPTLTYANTSVAAAGSTNVNPATASDNGMITGYSIVSVVPPMNVAPTVDSSGVVAITNAGPAGNHVITVQATDNCNVTTNAMFTLMVNCPTITVNPPSLPNGVVGTAYNQTITPSGGSSANYTYSSTGTLPPGLTLSPGPATTATLSGNPATSGNYSFTIIATDTNGCTGNQAYSVTINQAPAFTSAATTTFTVNIASSFAITTSGFPTVTTITQMGALPTGVMFTDNGNGTASLSGTPQPGTNGTYPLTLTASNGIAPNAVQNFTLVVSGLICPSILTVNDLGDAGDANPGDGICATSGGVCTLRAAVEEANAIPACTPLTINFSVTGTINLATVLPDLNHPNLTITGPGATLLDVHRNSATPFRIFAISASRTVTITGLKITNGLAAGTNNGGGVHNSGTLNLSQCVISGNAIETTSVGGSGFGGGIYSAGPLTIDRCEISGNSGRSGAGITHNGLGSGFPLIITNSTISGNTGVQSGGFDIRNTSATLTNCTISGNTAPGRIGGIDQVAQSGNTSSLLLTNCTVTNNTGSAAIETFGFAGVTSLTTTLKNTLVAGNVGANFTTTLGTLTSLGNNLDSDGTSGFTNGTNGDIVGASGSPINALLGPLTQNGGPTNTHLLLPGSPAIDKGGAGVSTDQRGQSRPYDFPAISPASNGGNNSDIGAVEVQCSVITLAGLPGGTAGGAYTQSNIASGGTAPYSLSLASGSLPSGVTISGNGLTGTPTQPGTFSFTLAATDAYGCTGSQSYIVSIVCPTITLSPATLPNAAVNVAYPQTITAAPAGSYTFSVTGGLLPAGLTLNSNGSFSGAPTQSGVFNFRVTATTFGSCSSFADYTLLVNCATVTVNPSSLPGGTLGTAYSQTVSASPAGTYFYSVTSGALPTGLTLNGATGAITGTPTNPGLFTFTVTAAAGSCNGSRSYTVEITCQGLSITPASLPAATAGSTYSQTINVTPAGSYTFSLAQGNLPSGLTLHPTTGVISGLPAVVGTVSFIVKVHVPNSCSTTQAYTLTTNCPPAVTLSPASLPGGALGTAYSQTLSASPAGGNYMYTVTSGSLPPGLTLNSATGVLSGTPTANGSSTFTVTATGFGSCAGSRSYTVVIGSGSCPTITLPASLPSGSVGQFYNSSVAASPFGSYSYTFTGSLPPGVTLYGSFGSLLGYPTANGTYNFTVTATGANNCLASQSYSVVIGTGSLQAVNDFSGDQRSDFVLWRSAQAQWLIVDSATNAARTTQWGQAGDLAVTGDYDGDGKADLAAFGKDGHWRVKLSGDGATLDKVWGVGSDVPVPGDYDGDGQTDLAVWRGAESGWYIQRSSDGQTQSVQWGTSLAPYLDVPVPGDYDGDGKTDIAVFRQANGHWYIRRSSDGRTVDKPWGLGTDVPVPGDYDGDGKTDIAVWRGSQGDWYIVRSSDGAVESKFWGAAYEPYFDVPAVGDYDGDGKTDVAVWRKPEGRWYVQQSSDGTTRAVTQGRTGDQPVTATPRQ